MFNEATFREILLRSLGHNGRSNSWSVASLNILVHDVAYLLYYKHWTDNWKYFYCVKSRQRETEKRTSEKSALLCLDKECKTRSSWYRMINVTLFRAGQKPAYVNIDTGICKYRYTRSDFLSPMIEITSRDIPAPKV